MGTNAAGLKQKMHSLRSKVNKFQPACIFIQETKLYKKGQVGVDGFQCFEHVRMNSKGGGLLLAVHESLNPVLIYEGNDEIELLVVQGKIDQKDIRFINAYGPQEDDNDEKIISFYAKLEEEIGLAFEHDCLVMIECDANAKLGHEIIKNAPNPQSDNGQLLWSLIERNNLTVVNSLEICEGCITRHRTTKISEEKAVLDYFIVCENLAEFVSRMTVDEERVDVLTKYANKKGAGKKVESDHNMLVTDFNIHYSKFKKNLRIEVYDFKNPDAQKEFLEQTSGVTLTSCFDTSRSITENTEVFQKTFKKIVNRCFKKVRIKKKQPSEIEEKLKELSDLKKEYSFRKDLTLCKRIEDLEVAIQNSCAEENSRKIREQVGNLSNLSGTLSSSLMWQVKKKVCRKSRDPPMAKRDKSGNLITTPEPLKKLYKEEYVYRLRHREIKPSLQTLKELKEDLWERRLRILNSSKSDDWSVEDVKKVMSSLKKDKARDPLGYDNDIFKPGVCGPDLVNAVTCLVNAAKNEICTPDALKLTNISTIYKNKGSRFDLVNDRGIFNMVIFRKILDKLIYNDLYASIDSNMSDSNVGGRKGRNIRNHLFIVYGIINSVMNGESPPVDLQFYDLQQCFDAMWLEESMNDLCNTIPEKDWNNKLAMVYKNNSENLVAVKTPFGMTERVNIANIVTQGGVWGPIQCSNQVDTLGKECVQRNINLYTYKGSVKVMPLAMIDDILAVSLCGINSVRVNSFINTKMEMKKLLFSYTKCKHVHSGKENPFCPDLQVHGNLMAKSKKEKYLGDLVCDTLLGDGSNEQNVKCRKSKGIGIVSQIMVILESVSLGSYYFEIAILLREALLINGILTNSEVWYGLTKTQISELEAVDRILLRRLLDAPISTPCEALYLELGVVPISMILKGRRLMYLHYLLNLEETEMLYCFFLAQLNMPGENDWTETVKQDLVDFEIGLSLQEVKELSHDQFKCMVKDKSRSAAFKQLMGAKSHHSKMSSLDYSELRIQQYLVNKSFHTGDAKLLFSFRTRMVEVKNNYKNRQSDLNCPLCGKDTDTQQHLLDCEKIHRSRPNVLYNDLFGDDWSSVRHTFDALKNSLRNREDLLRAAEEETGVARQD